jgi:hypothetical protein
MRIPVTHTNVGCQVLSRSQVTPGLSMSMRIRPICKVYIHTYIQLFPVIILKSISESDFKVHS